MKGRQTWNSQLISMFMCKPFIAAQCNWPVFPSLGKEECHIGQAGICCREMAWVKKPWFEPADGGAEVALRTTEGTSADAGYHQWPGVVGCVLRVV